MQLLYNEEFFKSQRVSSFYFHKEAHSMSSLYLFDRTNLSLFCYAKNILQIMKDSLIQLLFFGNIQILQHV